MSLDPKHALAASSSVDNDALWEQAERDSARSFRALDPRSHGLSVIGSFRRLSQSGDGGYVSSWSAQHEAEVLGLRVGGSDVLVSFKPEAGQKVWLVWCTHQEGDSFGSSGGHFAAIGAFASERAAQLAAETVRLHAQWGRWPVGHSLDRERFGLLDDEGRPMLVEASWGEPFSALEAVHVRAFILEAA